MIQTPALRRTLSFAILIGGACLPWFPTAHAAPSRTAPPVPDLTKGGKIDDKHDWVLGPTGARGWIWGWQLETTKARQIYITQVDAGSPSDKVLKPGDVILGVGGKPFSDDARHALGNAINAAEAGDGSLLVTRWRDGETSEETIKLPAIGGYSATAPYDCEKSQKILETGSRHIAERLTRDLPEVQASWPVRRYGSTEITNAVDAMALLATGNPEYAELVAKYARIFAPADLKLQLKSSFGMASWGWGYINIFLCEYYLATGDKSVLPAITEYATKTAEGQSFIGSWGHAMAWPEWNQGKLHGSLGGYGALNSAGLMCHLSLVLAQKCGVDNPEISKALTKANRFMAFYSGKGSIPYGDHFPGWDRHDDNGKNSMAAVIFDLQGETDPTEFFTTMTVASYGERERGHTGNYFSFLWGPLGAQRAGDAATAAFLKPQRWFYDLNRSWDGSFPYQGGAAADKGEHSYKGWDSTGVFVLTYAMPLRKLHITGKETEDRKSLTGEELDATIAAGSGFSSWDNGMAPYLKKPADTLIADLASWSPAVRFRAADALAQKPNSEQYIPRLVAMLESEDLMARYGGCQGLGAMKERASEAVEPLQALLWEKDTWLRIQAVSALAAIGEAAKSAVPALLELAIVEDDADPLQITQRYLAFGLFDSRKVYGSVGLISKSLDDVDRPLLYKAVEKILTNPDGRTRDAAGSVYSTLTFEELKPILPAILTAIREPSPSGVMFSSAIRLRGVEMLAKYHVREGMDLCLDIMEIDKWGKRKRISNSLKILATYGGAAKPVLPRLRQLEKDLLVHPEAKALAPEIEQLRKLIRDIETSTETVELRSLD